MAKIVSINISEKRGVMKQPITNAKLKIDWGIENDAHGGTWHRQISLLSKESIDYMVSKGLMDIKYGMFAENITTEGIEVHKLPIGTKLQMGDALVEVTQIGKKCHHGCEIFQKVGDCIMPREGIFVKVLKEGIINPNDEISII
ncbi:MAG: MOSC domain-containing protein [Anaerorhabdus sp.]